MKWGVRESSTSRCCRIRPPLWFSTLIAALLLTAPALPVGAQETNASYEEPGPEPDCWPHPELDNVMICEPPAECVDRLYETPECTPPPECRDQGDGTFACEMPEHDGYHDDGASDEHDDGAYDEGPPPECWPHPEEPDVVICEPPAECVDRLYETPECTPPPECRDQGDGTFACEMPEHDADEDDDRYADGVHRDPAPAHDDPRAYTEIDGEPTAPDGMTMDEIARDLFGEGTLFDDEASLEEARRAARQAAEDARASFRASLQELKAAYAGTREDLRDRYEVGRAELKAEHAACIEQARAPANASAARAQARACNEQARQALEELRSGLIEEHEALKERLLQEAETTRTSLCDRLDTRLGDILADSGLLRIETDGLLGPGDLPLCAHRLGGDLP